MQTTATQDQAVREAQAMTLRPITIEGRIIPTGSELAVRIVGDRAIATAIIAGRHLSFFCSVAQLTQDTDLGA